MRRRQTHHRRGAAAEPPCTLERHHVGRIGYDFGAAQRQQHLVLARVPHAGADAQRRDGRQLHRFKRRGRSQQMPINFDEAPLIDKRRLHETVTIPLLGQVSRPTSGSARACDLQQQRP
jgi:hypothetical protein